MFVKFDSPWLLTMLSIYNGQILFIIQVTHRLQLVPVDLDQLVTLRGIGILEYFQQDGFFA